MTADDAFSAYLDVLSLRILRHLEDFLPRAFDHDHLQRFVGRAAWKYDPEVYNAGLLTPIWDLISRKGKCWRAMFGIFLLESLGTEAEAYEQLICALAELTHNGALIIDDIEDDSLRRRGDECIHVRYGLDVATNAGNTLYFLPLLLIEEHPRLSDRQRLEIYQILMRFFVRAHFGQTADIHWSKCTSRANVERWLADSVGDQILQMYEHKTASAVEATTEVAAIIAGADAAQRQACFWFARAFGVAFQILDDIHNFSDDPEWTKVCGEDLAAGKLTYVVYSALRQLGRRDGERLLHILCTPSLRTAPDGLAEGIDLVRRSGALAGCHEKAQSILYDGWQPFADRVPASKPRQRLQMLCSRLLRGQDDLPIV